MASTQQMRPGTGGNMERGYDYYIAKYNSNPPPPPTAPPPPQAAAPAAPAPTPSPRNNTNQYAGSLGAVPMEPLSEEMPAGTPPRPPNAVSPSGTPTRDAGVVYEHDADLPPEGEEHEPEVDGDEALLDLAQLEELHHEAERMKALGNKHMAAQEYTRAYNAYSAALQLSPVGPSSHVFLSNRAAALLSLKRYSAAATDARRAIALAPTFGKAHARLGQSLYFLKEYEGAVAAYEDAIHYEPDNPITKTYLEKAKTKLSRQQEKAARAVRNEEVSVLTAESSIQATVINSIATDPNASAAVVETGFRGQSKAMAKAVGGDLARSYNLDAPLPEEDDPDFEEAIRIQERANRYLANKNYKHAIEEYTAALFLVPDDYNLSPDLHLGRAHALNGSRRHESAKIDAQLAIKIKPTPEAYSTLAKSMFYMKDYQGAIDAFGKCKDMLPEGETLSMFDRAYLQKSEAALQQTLQSDGTVASKSFSSAPIPKLPPPRFVPREEALSRTPNMPAMPKQWPQQSPRAAQTLQVGPEREVLFLSEALGIKLNRGPDGVVRVIDVSPEVPGSPIARQGKIEVGDVIREAAGVDIRRPITNIMWGDTVALIKMAPRPIALVVAQELNPSTIVDQRKEAAASALSPTSAAQFFPPSNSSGDGSVRKQMEHATKPDDPAAGESADTSNFVNRTDETSDGTPQLEGGDEAAAPSQSQNSAGSSGTVESAPVVAASDATPKVDTTDGGQPSPDVDKTLEVNDGKENPPVEIPAVDEQDNPVSDDGTDGQLQKRPPATSEPSKDIEQQQKETAAAEQRHSLRDEERQVLGGAEIFFPRQSHQRYVGWDNLRWMSFSGVRKVRCVHFVYRYQSNQRTMMFWLGDQYVARKIVIYDEPNLILILRPVENATELREVMDLPADAKIENPNQAMKSYLIVEHVIDPKTCKLKVSPLTHITSVGGTADTKDDDHRRRSCFELLNPIESVTLSAVKLRAGAERALTSFTDSGAFLETTRVEQTLQDVICEAHDPNNQSEILSSDMSWKHQIILGTLHSYVVLGNLHLLDKAITAAFKVQQKMAAIATTQTATTNNGTNSNGKFLDPRIVDRVDESGRTALHYACASRFSSAVISLVRAGANVNARLEKDSSGMTPCHISAMNLDDKSIAAILSVNRRPHILDNFGRTPVHLAVTSGRSVGGQRDSTALDRCLNVFRIYGTILDEAPRGHCHAISQLSSSWSYDELAVSLNYSHFRYPLGTSQEMNATAAAGVDTKRHGISASALFHYPIHAALIALRKSIKTACEEGLGALLWKDSRETSQRVMKTLEYLFACGFEPNERIEAIFDQFDGYDALAVHVGFAPIQIVAAAAIDVSNHKSNLDGKTYMNIVNTLINICEFLVKNGARIALDPPPMIRSIARQSSVMEAIVKEIVEKTGTGENDDVGFFPISRDQIRLSSNKELSKLLNLQRLKDAALVWDSIKKTPVVSSRDDTRHVYHTDKLPIEDSQAPGGSDEKSCAICWKSFGTLVNRKHRCRISRRHVCDECSTGRVSTVDAAAAAFTDGVSQKKSGEEHRVSDGQFLLVKADQARSYYHQQQVPSTSKANTEMMNKTVSGRPSGGGSGGAGATGGAAAARLNRLEAEEKTKRDSLFGGMIENVAKAVFAGEDTDQQQQQQQQQSASAGIDGLAASLNQTRDVLNQRGEKLNTLAEKTERLAGASRDFASMAKELNRQSQGGFFW